MFNQDKPIYLQIADRISEEILAGKYLDDERIPSVRDTAALLQVNANTTVKAYDELSRENIIYNKRGMGFFVIPGAKEQILKQRRRDFIDNKLSQIFREMKLLGITIDEIVGEYQLANGSEDQ